MPVEDFSRIRSMQRFLNLNISRENELENIVVLAAEACQTPAAFLVFFDEGKLKYQYKFGDLTSQIPEEISLWDLKLDTADVLVIPDTLADKNLANHALVVGDPGIRFYAGAALTTHDGQNIGSLYVLGQESKDLSERRKHMLQLLSRQAVNMVEFELSLSILKEQFLESKNIEIKLRSFFESSKSIHLLVGPDFEVLTFNKTFYDLAYRLFGVEVIAGADVAKYIHPDYLPTFSKDIQTALTGTTVQYEKEFRLKGIEPAWYKITFNPAYDNEGNIIGVSYNATDITQRKENEEKILQQNEVLRNIAFMQSHEMRKPVASILGLMNLLKLEDAESKPEILEMMEKAVLDLDDTIHRIVKSTETQEDPKTIFQTPNA